MYRMQDNGGSARRGESSRNPVQNARGEEKNRRNPTQMSDLVQGEEPCSEFQEKQTMTAITTAATAASTAAATAATSEQQ